MLEGLESFDSTVNAWFGAVKVAAQEAAVGLATVALNKMCIRDRFSLCILTMNSTC